MSKQNILNNDYTYRLVELADEMQKSIETANNVINQQNVLVEIINASDRKDEFEAFINSLSETTADQAQKAKDCEDRLKKINAVISLCQSRTTKKTAIQTCTMLLEGLGLMRPETTEEKKD